MKKRNLFYSAPINMKELLLYKFGGNNPDTVASSKWIKLLGFTDTECKINILIAPAKDTDSLSGDTIYLTQFQEFWNFLHIQLTQTKNNIRGTANELLKSVYPKFLMQMCNIIFHMNLSLIIIGPSGQCSTLLEQDDYLLRLDPANYENLRNITTHSTLMSHRTNWYFGILLVQAARICHVHALGSCHGFQVICSSLHLPITTLRVIRPGKYQKQKPDETRINCLNPNCNKTITVSQYDNKAHDHCQGGEYGHSYEKYDYYPYTDWPPIGTRVTFENFTEVSSEESHYDLHHSQACFVPDIRHDEIRNKVLIISYQKLPTVKITPHKYYSLSKQSREKLFSNDNRYLFWEKNLMIGEIVCDGLWGFQDHPQKCLDFDKKIREMHTNRVHQLSLNVKILNDIYEMLAYKPKLTVWKKLFTKL